MQKIRKEAMRSNCIPTSLLWTYTDPEGTIKSKRTGSKCLRQRHPAVSLEKDIPISDLGSSHSIAFTVNLKTFLTLVHLVEWIEPLKYLTRCYYFHLKGVCYGFEIMDNAESPNVPFTVIYQRFPSGKLKTIVFTRVCWFCRELYIYTLFSPFPCDIWQCLSFARILSESGSDIWQGYFIPSGFLALV